MSGLSTGAGLPIPTAEIITTGPNTIVSPVVTSYSPDATFGIDADAVETVSVSGVLAKFVSTLSGADAATFLNAFDISGLKIDDTLGQVHEILTDCEVTIKTDVSGAIKNAIETATVTVDGTAYTLKAWMNNQLRAAFLAAFPNVLPDGTDISGSAGALTAAQVDSLKAAWDAFKAAKSEYDKVSMPVLKNAYSNAKTISDQRAVAAALATRDAEVTLAAYNAGVTALEAATVAKSVAESALTAAEDLALALAGKIRGTSEGNAILATDPAVLAAAAAKDAAVASYNEKAAAVAPSTDPTPGPLTVAKETAANVLGALVAAATAAAASLSSYRTAYVAALQTNASAADVIAATNAANADSQLKALFDPSATPPGTAPVPAGYGLAMDDALADYIDAAQTTGLATYNKLESLQAYMDLSGFTGVIPAQTGISGEPLPPGALAVDGPLSAADPTTLIYNTLVSKFSVNVDVSGEAASAAFLEQQNKANAALRRSLFRQIPKATWTQYYIPGSTTLNSYGLPLVVGDSIVFIFDVDLKATKSQTIPTAGTPNVISMDLGVRRVAFEFHIVGDAVSGKNVVDGVYISE